MASHLVIVLDLHALHWLPKVPNSTRDESSGERPIAFANDFFAQALSHLLLFCNAFLALSDLHALVVIGCDVEGMNYLFDSRHVYQTARPSSAYRPFYEVESIIMASLRIFLSRPLNSSSQGR